MSNARKIRNVFSAVMGAASMCAIAAGFMTVAPSEAEAQSCTAQCLKTQLSVIESKTAVMGHITSEMFALQNAVTNALKLHAGQITNNLEATMRHQTNLYNTKEMADVRRRIEDASFQATKSASSGFSSCAVITGNMTNGGTEAVTRVVQLATAEAGSRWVLGEKGTKGEFDASAAVEARLAGHMQFCSAKGRELGLCTQVAEPKLQNADINITKSLFSAPTLTGPQEEATDLYIINSVSPNPLGTITAGSGANVNGRAFIADRFSAASRESAALHVLAASRASRKALPGGKVATKEGSVDNVAWARGEIKNIVGYSDPVSDEGVSWYQWMDIRAKGWFLDSEWQANIATTATQESATKDMAAMMSFMVYLQWKQYELQERNAIVNAMMLSIISEENRRGPNGAAPINN